ncbi:MAG: hypothetical protein NZ581_01575 [Candidatus Caldarchaeum sp.]|nr:hypothetical protein [Candidatus Caldarchaeum sp.]MDW8434879.1 V4R domain-containing protein [Candidatus Caldarchaeum sp.]
MRRLLAGSTSTSAADALLWHFGKRYGIALSRKASEMTKTAVEGMNLLVTGAQKSGWGMISVQNRLDSDGTVEVVFENCAFCEGIHDEKGPSCYFLAGILSGIAEVLFGDGYSARETKCKAVRGDLCSFLVARF